MELLDSASAVVQARLVLEKGVGDGCLQLPSTLPTGNYRLVAYTRYMRNEGEEVFFEKPLAVVNTFVTNETLLTDTLLPAYSFTRREGPVSVSPDRMTYDTRSGGEIRINGLPPDLQTLSVSIAGIDLYKPSARSGIVDWKQSMPTTGSSPADRKFLAETKAGDKLDNDFLHRRETGVLVQKITPIRLPLEPRLLRFFPNQGIRPVSMQHL